MPLVTQQSIFKKLPHHSEEYFLEKNAKIFMVRWKDSTLVDMASNEHGLQPLKKVDCHSPTEKKKIAMSMTNVICMYNRHMSGVDLMKTVLFTALRFKEKMVLITILLPLECLCVS